MTFDDIKTQRDVLARTDNAIDPAQLEAGAGFYVVGFTRENGAEVRHSGVYLSTVTVGHDKRFVVHLDGEPEARTMTVAQLGFFAPESLAMLVVVRTLDGVTYDKDSRSEAAKRIADERARAN